MSSTNRTLEDGTSERRRRHRLAVLVVFLNEERYLPVFLRSMALQTRTPDVLVLVDDGSSDASPALAQAFANARPNVRLLQRPARPASADRLASAAELKAFQWAVEQLEMDWDIVAKMDADLELTPETIATVAAAFEADPELGMAGPMLSERRDDGSVVPVGNTRRSPEHVEGATKFYARGCWEQIAPIAPILGWDTADEYDARRHGWSTRSVAVSSGNPVHLRRMGTHGPILRSFRRWGRCAWGYGAHPLHVALYSAQLMVARPPRVVGGLNFAVGWGLAGMGRAPRAAPSLRADVRRQQLVGIRRRLRGFPSSLIAATGRKPDRES